MAHRDIGAGAAEGLSDTEIAQAIGLSTAAVQELLSSEARRGIVVRGPGGWRLTTDAERRYGHALRALGDGPIALRSSFVAERPNLRAQRRGRAA